MGKKHHAINIQAGRKCRQNVRHYSMRKRRSALNAFVNAPHATHTHIQLNTYKHFFSAAKIYLVRAPLMGRI